jgi:hypothetical protein
MGFVYSLFVTFVLFVSVLLLCLIFEGVRGAWVFL